jgi:Amino acid synthesis
MNHGIATHEPSNPGGRPGLNDFPPCVRKVQYLREAVLRESDFSRKAGPFMRVAAAVAFENLWIASHPENLGALTDLGEKLAKLVMPDLQEMLDLPPIAYGKAALVGSAGNLQHGAALIHPKLGRPVRAAIGGGKAVIPSSSKVGIAGTTIDVPLAHKDDSWLFDYIDTMPLCVSDAPRSNEMVLFIALAASERPFSKF